MITDPFDLGPTGTFKTLCQKYPDDTVYKGADGFRSLWGPIFYRGRATTARLLGRSGRIPRRQRRSRAEFCRARPAAACRASSRSWGTRRATC